MKKFMSLLLASVLLTSSVALGIQYATNSDFGFDVVVPYQTYTDLAAATRVDRYVQDVSIYPTSEDPRGLVVRHYDFEYEGWTNGVINMMQKYSNVPMIPSNTVVVGGFVWVKKAFAPVNNTNQFSIGLLTSNDVVALNSNTWASTGIKPLGILGVTSNSADTLVVTTNSYLTFNSFFPITQGEMNVYLDLRSDI
jgi:hypothetical protein